MSGIDPNQINTFAYGIGSKQGEAKTNGEKTEAKDDQSPKPAVNHKPADEVMNMLAMQGAMNITHAKVDTDVETRIAESMVAFEKEVAKGLQSLEQEFGGALSEQDMLALAAQAALGDIE